MHCSFFFFFFLHFNSPDGLGQDMLSSSDKGILDQSYLRFFSYHLHSQRKERDNILLVETLAFS